MFVTILSGNILDIRRIQKALVDGCVNTAGCNRRGDVRALEQLR